MYWRQCWRNVCGGLLVLCKCYSRFHCEDDGTELLKMLRRKGETMKKKVFLAVAAAVLFGSGFSAYGAPQTMLDGAVFDAEWYRGQYPDVDAAFPADASAEMLYEHYVVYGAGEGRLPFEGASAAEMANGAAADGALTEGMPADGTPAEGVPAEGVSAEEKQAGGTAAEGVPADGTPENPAPETTGRVIDPSRPMVALTFDDGPFSPVGNQIMDCLAQYGGKATFYVVGDRCGRYTDEMQRMAAEGHEIGNHTYSHKYLNKLGAAEIQSQVQRGNEAILAASGVPAATVRLPGGNKNATVLANVNAPMIMWSIDTLDWKTRNTASTVNAVLGQIRDGDIVLMHELYTATGNAAVQIIPALAEQGYQLVTVSELAQYRGCALENGKVYYSFRP